MKAVPCVIVAALALLAVGHLATAVKVVPTKEHHRIVSTRFGPDNVTQHSGRCLALSHQISRS